MTRPHLTELYRETRAKAEADNAERRTLVLGYDDLAKRLTVQPINYATPQQWSGFIPPFMIEGRYDKDADRDSWTRNPSPVRVHLVALCHEAYARTYGEAIGNTWLEEINTNQWADDWSPHDALRRAANRLEHETR